MTQRPLKQSDHSFTVGPRFQTIWGIREAIVFALEGLGASAFLLFAAIDHVNGMIGAIFCMVVAVILLLSHLGKPMLAWRAIINIRYSWISRGTLAIGLFTALASAYVAGLTIPELGFVASLSELLMAGAVVTGLFILLYPGLAMKASAGITAWRSPFLPLLSFLQGALSGTLLAGVVSGEPVTWTLENDFTTTCVGLIVLCTVSTSLYVHFMCRRDGAGRLSADWLIKKEWLIFWTLAVGMGFILPIALFITEPSNVYLLTGVILARIIGDIAFRYALLKIGAYESVA